MIDYVNKDLFGQNSIDKQWTITISKDGTTKATYTNSDIEYDSIYLTEAISSSDGLVFGRCESSRFEFTVHYDVVPTVAPYKTFKGCDVIVDLVLNHDTLHPFRVGHYIVDEDKPTADKHYRKIICYDRLSELADKDIAPWYKTLQFPMTIKSFRDSFFNYIGITQETTTLCNDNITIYKTLDADEELSGISIIQAICELNGAFGHIGRDDIFHYVRLGEIIEGLFPAEDLYPADDLYPRDESVDIAYNKNQWINVEYEDYRVKEIDGVIVMDEEGTIAGYSSQNLSNPFKVENNFLTYNINRDVYSTIANNLNTVVHGHWYMTANVECPANLCVEVGDKIRVNAKEKIIYMYVLYRNMSGNQFMKDKLESTGDEDRSKDLNSVSKQLARLRTKSAYDIDVASARIGNLEADHVSVADLSAQRGRIDNLSSSVAIIDTKLYAAQGDIDTLYTRTLNISNSLTVTDGNVTALQVDVNSLTTKCVHLTASGTISGSYIKGGTINGVTLTGCNIMSPEILNKAVNWQYIVVKSGNTVTWEGYVLAGYDD